MKAVCAALAPSAVVPREFAAGAIDKRLADGAGNGWRYEAAMPPDGESYKIGFKTPDDAARLKVEV